MIAINLTLMWKMNARADDWFDYVDMADISDCNISDETINKWLNFWVDDRCKYAELHLEIDRTETDILIGSFKKIKLKGNTPGTFKYKWMVA